MSWYSDSARDPKVGPIIAMGKSVARAKGYSPLELERAGLTEAGAERLGIPVDRHAAR
jgi:ribosomal protein L13E